MLPADQRLRKNGDFRLIYKRGRENVHPMAVLYMMRRMGPDGEKVGRRIGFVVSKKQGDAVVRNRIKRRLREAVRLRLPDMRPGAYDLVFVARGRLKTARWTEIQEAVDLLLQRTRLLIDNNTDKGIGKNITKNTDDKIGSNKIDNKKDRKTDGSLHLIPSDPIPSVGRVTANPTHQKRTNHPQFERSRTEQQKDEKRSESKLSEEKPE